MKKAQQRIDNLYTFITTDLLHFTKYLLKTNQKAKINHQQKDDELNQINPYYLNNLRISESHGNKRPTSQLKIHPEG